MNRVAYHGLISTDNCQIKQQNHWGKVLQKRRVLRRRRNQIAERLRWPRNPHGVHRSRKCSQPRQPYGLGLRHGTRGRSLGSPGHLQSLLGFRLRAGRHTCSVRRCYRRRRRRNLRLSRIVGNGLLQRRDRDRCISCHEKGHIDMYFGW